MSHKKEFGQFFTSKTIAKHMVKWVLEKSPSKLLDPAVGLGVFLDIADSINPNVEKVGYEIDPVILNKYCNNHSYKSLVYNKDYLSDFSDIKYDSIICNPPYNRFQNIKNRKEYISDFEKKIGIKLNGYSNQCVYFLIKSISELSINGRCCYIMPYEFLNTGYGEIVKKILVDRQIVHSIIKFDPCLSLFEDALTTSCIIFIENKKHRGINFIKISELKQLNDFDLNDSAIKDNTNYYEYSKLDVNKKWNYYFEKKITSKPIIKNLVAFNSICSIKRGIATGNNQYFTLNKSKISSFNLSEDVCLPCITKSPDINDVILNKKVFNELVSTDKKMYLFDGTKSKTRDDLAYIKYGEKNNCHTSYLTSHRTPWYSIENREPAPILISVFCRNKIKVIRNEIMARNLTAFHGVYFNNDVSENYINILFCYLLTPIAQEILFTNKREYGNSLDKFEPNDLNNSFIVNIDLINNNTKKEILDIYSDFYVTKNHMHDIEVLNKIFTRIIFDN